MTPSLTRLTRPRTIAVVGGKEARRVVEQCDRMGFTGEIWPIHPRETEILGRRTYRTVADLPAAPDAAFVGVNRELTVEIVRALAERGAGGAVCYASGFREAVSELPDGDDLQQALVAAAGTMPILGPNCYGFINMLDGALLWPDQHGMQRIDRGVAVLTQSSNIALNISMQRRGLPLAYILTAGNQAQTGLSHLALAVLEDPRVTAVGLHVEGFDSVAALERLAARARTLKKPVVILKVGRSEQAQRATISHTASLAGNDAVSTALLARLGIARVDTLPDLLETLKLLHVAGPLRSRAVSSMSCSGGEASLMADAGLKRRIDFRALTDAQIPPLRAALGPMVALTNPLDYHTFAWANREKLTTAFTAMLGGGYALNLVVLDFPREDRCDGADWAITTDALAAAAEATNGTAGIVASMAENMPEKTAAALMASGIVPFWGIEEALAAAEAAADIGAAWSHPESAPLLTVEAAAGVPVTLTEHAAKQALSAHGLRVPRGVTAATPEAIAAAADTLRFPVALKGLGIAHKTEAGAVRLGLKDAAEVRDAATAMAGIASGYLVEEMVEKPVAELIVGAMRDPVAGPVLTIGSGGILVELLGDSAILTLPTDESAIRAAISGLKVAKLLEGYRGGPRGDVEALVTAVASAASYVVSNASIIEELDVNPLMVLPAGDGVVAADALIRLRKTA